MMSSGQLISISIVGELSFGDIIRLITAFDLDVLRVNLLTISQLVTLVHSM